MRIVKIGSIALSGIFIVCLMIGTSFGASTDPVSFYKGRVIDFIVPYPPGGGFDAVARLMKPYIDEALQATTVIRNIPGAGGTVGTNQLYNTSPKDGSAFALPSGDTILAQQLIGFEGVRFDLKKMSWIARVGSDGYVFVTNANKNFKSLEDLLKAKKFRIGGVAAGATVTNMGSVVARSLVRNYNVDMNLVTGYSGSSPVIIALLQGEVDGIAMSVGTILPYIKRGELIPLFVVGTQRHKDLPGVPSMKEIEKLYKNNEKWVVYVNNIIQMERVIVGPPGLLENRLNFLRKIFHKVLNDDRFKKEYERVRKESVNYASGEEIENIVRQLLDLSKPEREEALLVFRDASYIQH